MSATDTANIVQIIYHGLQRDRKSAPLELADNAARTFDAALDGIDRAWLARNTRLVAQNIQLGFDLADAGFVQHHHLLHLHRGFDQQFLVVLRQPVNREKVSQFHSFSLLGSLSSAVIIPHSAIGYNPQTSPLLWAIRHLPMKCPLCGKFSAARIFSAAADHTVSNGGKGT